MIVYIQLYLSSLLGQDTAEALDQSPAASTCSALCLTAAMDLLIPDSTVFAACALQGVDVEVGLELWAGDTGDVVIEGAVAWAWLQTLGLEGLESLFHVLGGVPVVVQVLGRLEGHPAFSGLHEVMNVGVIDLALLATHAFQLVEIEEFALSASNAFLLVEEWLISWAPLTSALLCLDEVGDHRVGVLGDPFGFLKVGIELA